MANLRFEVVAEAFKKRPVEVDAPKTRPSEYFAKYVFNRQKMYKYLPSDVYEKLIDVIDNGTRLDRSIADSVAAGMKLWAEENGVTHYTHWFQPLTEGTAEKHDAFVEHDGKGGMIEEFSGKLLVQQEPDASSFPNGGIRNTFEARGYSAWDPTSPVFIIDDTLCIPTIFISYTGEALDYKAPLLRSLHTLSEAATDVCHYFYPQVKKVQTNLGWEQEYFLVDESLYSARPDLMLTGRTLMGHDSAKNQQMDDHYFGTIPERVQAFMKDLEIQALELGIPCKTRHNEVAPNQFELAPIYEECNLAVDHNMLLMSLMKRVAHKHSFRVLLHEKPFAGVNGSGKHNNWSISAGKKNLLDPGENPMENLRFLVFLTGVIQAVDEYQELLRMSVASAGNDHRLGANEAPPAIVSIFLGDELGGVVDALIEDHDYTSAERVSMDLGVDVLPNFLKDNTDRNRTSPFAFTGNKFEFRMPGSSVNLADCNMILNTAMAKSLKEFADEMEGKTGEEFEAAAIEYIKKTLRDHKRIIFNGDGYSEEWPEEAARRGLANHATTADALPCFIEQRSIDLFEEFGVLSESEVRSRYEVKLEKYNKLLNIEVRTMKRLVRRDYLPAINTFAADVARHISEVRAVMPDADLSFQERKLRRCVEGAAEINNHLERLNDLHHEAQAIADEQERANKYAHEVIPVMDDLRQAVDSLEILVESKYWPVPSYNNILFYA